MTSLPGCLGAEGAVVEAPLESMAARTAAIQAEGREVKGGGCCNKVVGVGAFG